jgi:putative DNA primase/helicase
VTGPDELDALTVDALEHRWTSADDFPAGTTDEDVRTVLGRIGVGPPRLTLVAASEITIRRPTFLWDRRLPDSAVSLFAGREGLGKTVLATWLAARVTQGQLTGSRLGRPADIVYVGTEDDRATVLVPRLLAAGADLERAHFVDLALDGSYSVARDAAALSGQLDRIDPGLVIIDPVDAHLGGGVDSHKKAEVQAALGILARLAQRYDCAVLAVAHLNKGDSRDVLTKVVGSVGFTTSVRAVLAVGEHPDEPADRVCVLRKANMADAAAVPAFRYRVESVAVEAPGGAEPIDTAGVVVLGEEHGLDPNAILSIPDAEERTARDEAADWLRDVLADGPLPAKSVKRMAADADISPRTLQRARVGLGVVVQRDDHASGRPSTWTLPGSVPSGSCQDPCATGGTKSDDPADQGLPFDAEATCHRPDSGAGTNGPGIDGTAGLEGPGTDGPDADGPDADGPDADGPDADGPDADGPDADGPDAGGLGADGLGTGGPGTDGPGADGVEGLASGVAGGPDGEVGRGR